MGYLYSGLWQHELASQLLLQALDTYEKVNDMLGLSVTLTRLAVVQQRRHNPKEALAHARTRLTHCKDRRTQ